MVYCMFNYCCVAAVGFIIGFYISVCHCLVIVPYFQFAENMLVF